MAENTVSYLTILLNDNEQLKNLLTSYLNNKLALEAEYAKDVKVDLSKALKPEEKRAMVEIISMFRAYATRIKISINVIKNKFPDIVYSQIEEDYNKIKSLPLPEYETCERFVQNINDMLGTQLQVASTFRPQS